MVFPVLVPFRIALSLESLKIEGLLSKIGWDRNVWTVLHLKKKKKGAKRKKKSVKFRITLQSYIRFECSKFHMKFLFNEIIY